MTTERWDDAKLDKFASTVERAIVASDERLTRIENLVKFNHRESNERLTRIENLVEFNHRESNERLTRIENLVEFNHRESNERLTRIEQAVESNNRFLESFSQDIKRYSDTMNNLATRIDGVIAASNQDRDESNSRLAVIQRQVTAIARHLGVI